jgi:hypothetical protein
VRRHFRIALTGAMLPLLAACASVNFSAPTDQVYIPAVGANDRSGTVDVLNALVVSSEDGRGTLIATLVDNGADAGDALVEVSADDMIISPAAVGIPARGYVDLSDLAPIVLIGDRVAAGNFITVTFTFEVGESITITVPVLEQTGPFEGIDTVPSPTASPTVTETASE